MAAPALMRLVSADLASPLYEYASYVPLWEELMRIAAARELLVGLLLEVCVKVAQYVVAERLTQRCKALFEDFLRSYRRCFLQFGPGANAAVQSAKAHMKAHLKSKPPAVKLLAVLDEMIVEQL